MCSYFVVGGWFIWKPGHLQNVTVTVLAVKGDVATKNVTAVTGFFFFLLPHPFTALAGACDDIFLYFGSVCCQLLIVPSALGRGRNVCEWATTPAVVISEVKADCGCAEAERIKSLCQSFMSSA